MRTQSQRTERRQLAVHAISPADMHILKPTGSLLWESGAEKLPTNAVQPTNTRS